MHTHVARCIEGPSLQRVLPGFSGIEDKGPEEAPASPPTPSHGTGRFSVPLPIPHQGHLEQMESTPPQPNAGITSHLRAPQAPPSLTTS